MPNAKQKSIMTSAAEEGRKDRFVRALAQFLSGDQAKKSILLGMPNGVAFSLAQEWATLRGHSPLMGYGTVEEAEAQLNKWLRGKD